MVQCLFWLVLPLRLRLGDQVPRQPLEAGHQGTQFQGIGWDWAELLTNAAANTYLGIRSMDQVDDVLVGLNSVLIPYRGEARFDSLRTCM